MREFSFTHLLGLSSVFCRALLCIKRVFWADAEQAVHTCFIQRFALCVCIVVCTVLHVCVTRMYSTHEELPAY